MEDYYEYLDSNGVTTLYKLIKDDTVALIDSYSVTINGITTTLDTHINDSDIHTPIADIENMVDTKISGLVNSAPETLDTLKELSDALGNDTNFATTVANQIGNKANKDSVYTKEETNTLLEGKANSVHNHVVKDITDFPTIPTKLSQLENDMGFGTGGGSGDNSNCVHKTGDETIDGTKTFTNKLISNKELHYTDTKYDWTDTSLNTWCDAGHVAWFDKTGNRRMHELVGANDGVWRKACYINENQYFSVDSNRNISFWGNTTFNGNIYATNAHITHTYTNRITAYSIVHPTDYSYFFMSGGTDYDKGATLYLGGISATNFTPGRFALAARKTDGSSVELAGSPDGSLTWGGKNIALDENLVHTTGDEHISGNKVFTNIIHRYADLTTSGGVQVYRFVDTNANSCGHIFNNAHWAVDTIINSLGAYNEKSGKTTEIHIVSNDAGEGMAYVEGSARKGNLETVTSATGHAAIATMGWVNNPATSTNVVHRSGDEVISGVKSFNNLMYIYDSIVNKNSQMDLFTTPANTLYAQYTFADKNNEVSAFTQYGQQNTGTDYIGLFIRDKNRALYGLQVTTNNEVRPFHNNTYNLGSSTNKWANVYATNNITNMVITYSVRNHNNTSSMTVCGGSAWDTGSTLFLYGNSHSNYPGAFNLAAKNTTNECKLIGFPNGSLTWGGKDIATTAWVINYVNSVRSYSMRSNAVNSVAGSNAVGSSIAAYYSNATTLTAEGSFSSSGSSYPSDYSDYIDISPKVGTIYTGSQLFSSLTPTASGTIKKSYTDSGTPICYTTAKATATFSGAFEASAKYQCTTANAVKFRAYVDLGTPGSMGAASVIDNSSARSIFIRVQ